MSSAGIEPLSTHCSYCQRRFAEMSEADGHYEAVMVNGKVDLRLRCHCADRAQCMARVERKREKEEQR